MKKFTYVFCIVFGCCFLFTTQASGFLCVNDDFDPGFDFQQALDSVTDTNNEIRLKQGIYNIAAGSTGHFNIITNHSLTISGGWNDDCTLQADAPELTILHGADHQEGFGGVLYVGILDNPSPTTALMISNMTFQNGSAELEGGGVYIRHSSSDEAITSEELAKQLTVNITDVIAQSSSASAFGSGIAVFDQQTEGMNLSIADCIVQDNTVPADSGGGPAGIFVDTWITPGINVVITGSQILNNVAEFWGGGLYIDPNQGIVTLVNNVIAGNRADNFGGGIYLSNVFEGSTGANYTLTNNTITGNINTGVTSDLDGGGTYLEYADPASLVNIYNNIIYGNSAPGDGADLYIKNTNGQTYVYNNDFNTNIPAGFYIESQTNYNHGNNKDNEDPLFACTESNNYHLTSLSPVQDHGSNTAPSVPSDDLDGLPRPFNDTVDMGAYEFRNVRSVLPGDINDDGEVNIQDALLGAQILAGIMPEAPICKNADINDEGILGNEDVLFILQKISGLEK